MVEVEVGVLEVLAHNVDCLFYVFSLLVRLVAEDHLVHVAAGVIGEVVLLVLVEHSEEEAVILNRLTLVLRVAGDIFHHGLQDRNDLLGEVLELFALVIKPVFLERVVHMVLNVQHLTVFF